MADLDIVRDIEKARKDEYFVGKLGKAFSVSEMLDSVISRDERSKEHNIMRDINVNRFLTEPARLF